MCFWNKYNLIIFKKEEIMSSEIIIYTIQDGKTKLQVNLQDETVWLNRHQIAELFDRDIKTIGKHINNIFKEGELEKIQLSQILRQLPKIENIFPILIVKWKNN